MELSQETKYIVVW